MVGGGHGSPGNSDGGGNGGGGRGGRGGSGGGSGGNGGPGRDTPGSPNAPDGKRGSTMGPSGGSAGPSGRGDNTPGDPNNPGRRGKHAIGTTSQSRARDAMARHSREAARRDGIGKEYGLTAALQAKADEGTMSPREADMAIGMAESRKSQGLTQAMSAPVGDLAGAISGLPGVSSLGKIGLSTAADAGVPGNPESKYGAAHTKSRMSNNAAQSAGQVVGGLLGGPMGAAAVGAVNAATNQNATADIGRLGESMGVDSGSPAPSNTAGAGGKRGTPSAARSAMSPSAQPAQSFSWNPINMKQYGRGLLSLAQSS